MKIESTKIEGAFILHPQVHGDERGYFHAAQMSEAIGRQHQWIQDNESCSQKNVLRGLHFQRPPMAQAKLVRVSRGAVLDVIVDLRKDSSTFGQSLAVELNAKDKNQLLVPRGMAHGFLTLEPDTVFCYKCDEYYSAQDEGVLLWNDPSLKIEWPMHSPLVSSKDQNGLSWKDIDSPFTMANS
jgi:dTDP-4-dehydrorhamnose 3,5-epimerase